MKIICINGQGGVGKDTFVGYCGYEDEGIYKCSMVDTIKQIAEWVGWTGTKELKDRKFLSDLKDLCAEYSDFPFLSTVNRVKDMIRKYKWYHDSDNEVIVFVHAREPEDIQRWKDEYGARSLIIRRTDIEGTYGNHADDNVFDIDYDYVFWNNGDLYHLKDTAKRFIAFIREEEWESNINGKDN